MSMRLSYSPALYFVALCALNVMLATAGLRNDRPVYATICFLVAALMAFFAGYSYGWRETVNDLFYPEARDDH